MRFGDDRLDGLIDKALAEYSQASPRDGLEQRILANLSGQENQKGWRWIWVAGCAAAAIVLAILFLRPQPKQQEIAKVIAPRIPQQTPAPKVLNSEQSTIPSRPSRPVQRKVPIKRGPSGPPASPKLATFPSQTADDELAMLAAKFAQAHPTEAIRLADEQEKFRQLAAAFTAPVSEEQ